MGNTFLSRKLLKPLFSRYFLPCKQSSNWEVIYPKWGKSPFTCHRCVSLYSYSEDELKALIFPQHLVAKLHFFLLELLCFSSYSSGYRPSNRVISSSVSLSHSPLHLGNMAQCRKAPSRPQKLTDFYLAQGSADSKDGNEGAWKGHWAYNGDQYSYIPEQILHSPVWWWPWWVFSSSVSIPMQSSWI